MSKSPDKITGANAGGLRLLAMRTRWAARAAQFGRWRQRTLAKFDTL
jgi:hypothetical protein